MDWIKRIKRLGRKREIIRIAAMLKMTGTFDYDRKIASESCMQVWEWADDNVSEIDPMTGTGRVEIGEGQRLIIDHEANIPGFADAMIEVGWLHLTPTHIEFPNYARHNGSNAKRRAQDAARQHRHRLVMGQPSSKGDKPSHSERDNPSRSQRDTRVTREEKRTKKNNPSDVQQRGANLWDAFCAHFRMKPVSRSERARVGGLVKQLTAYEAGPDDIPVRAKRYKEIFKNCVLTPEALVKHWPQCEPPRRQPTSLPTAQPSEQDQRLPADEQRKLFNRAKQEARPASPGSVDGHVEDLRAYPLQIERS